VWNDSDDESYDDPIASARGLVWGFIVAIVFWFAVGMVLYWIF